MIAAEFQSFVELMRPAEQLYGKTLDDQLRRIYWDALRDLSLETVRAAIARAMRCNKFFPKPAELRRQDERQRDDVALSAHARRSTTLAMLELAEQDPVHNGHLKHAIEHNRAMWAEWKARDPQGAALAYRLAQLDRILVEARPDSPEYAEALAEEHRLRPPGRRWVG